MGQENESSEPPEFEDSKIMTMSAELALGAMGFLFNLILMVLICWNPKRNLRKTYLVCVLNLACTDTIFAVIFMFMSTSKLLHRRVYVHYSECVVEGVINGLFGVYSLCSVMLLTLDRFFTVVLRRPFTIGTTLFCVLAILALSLVAGFSPMYFQAARPFVVMPAETYCLMDLTRKDPKLDNMVYFLVSLYGIALACISLSYLMILHVVWRGNGVLKTLWEMGQFHVQNSQQSIVSRGAPRTRVNSTSTQDSTSPSRYSWPKFPVPLATVARKIPEGVGAKPSMEASTLHSFSSHPRKRNTHMGSALRTVLMGSTHISLYIPFGTCAIFQIMQCEGLGTLDLFSMYCIICCPIMDPFWTLLLDRHVHRSMDEIMGAMKQLLVRK